MERISTKIDATRFQRRRADMVARRLLHRNISDERVLDAMSTVPRHLFVPSGQQEQAYEDRALPIGFGQTISQPYVVALMLESLELKGSERVLEIGTGSGYQAALLGKLAREVFSVELLPALATLARETLRQLAIRNVEVMLKDGTLGHVQAAPYDAIVVAAGAPSVPKALLDQLADNGVMLIPVGNHELQQLLCVQKHDGSITSRAIVPCSFVPLLGKQGWAAPGDTDSLRRIRAPHATGRNKGPRWWW